MPLNNNNPKHQLTVEEQRKGGIKSGEVRAEKKAFKDLAKTLLDLEVKGKTKRVMEELGVSSEDMTQKTACLLGMMKAAQGGSVQAFEKLQELTGELGQKETNNGILDELAEFLKKC